MEHMAYHMVMARRQVLVQLDDDTVDRLDALALQLSVSRSELLRRGAEAVLHAEDWAHADRELVEAYRRTPVESALLDAGDRAATDTAPPW